ncbi:MAG TPA: ATP-binding cassette domain-containing protein [Pirellulales bacterium]|jgi:ABC-2 type transport system ATP-binding protein|nr:ATP-binding cassette domain-containing protein [Pirellulales bacterium]
MAVLELDALTRRFGQQVAVDAVTMQVEAREILGLLGPNGAGKTTTLKMLTTLLPPTAGTARVVGYDIVTQSAAVRRMMGYVPQLVSADGGLSGYENLLLFARLYDVPRRQQRDRVDEALAFMGLADAAQKMVRHYSGGMIRRLEIAQAMLHRPPVLFLDEPTVGLDPIAREAVWDRIGQLRDDYGTTILFTTHLMEEADTLCTRVAIMHLGKMAALGQPSELKASLGTSDATLDDVFVYYAGAANDTGGNYREISRARRTARRLG